VQAQEAIVLGVLGLAAIFAWRRHGDGGDRWLALGCLWISLMGSLVLLLVQLGDQWAYPVMALRLTAAPVLVLILEETLRGGTDKRKRRHALLFALFTWLCATGLYVYYDHLHDGPVARLTLAPLGVDVRFTVSAWMVLLALAGLTVVATLIAAAVERVWPGLAGWVATVLVISEVAAVVDGRWAHGALSWDRDLTYRTVLTLSLTALLLIKGLKARAGWLQSAAGQTPGAS
jgi:hypothetical protein